MNKLAAVLELLRLAFLSTWPFSPPSVAGATTTELVEQWRKACENRDSTAWQALFSEEATYEDPAVRRPVQARLHRGPLSQLWAQAAQWQCVVREYMPLEGGGAIVWSASAKLGGDELGFVGLAVFAVENGKVAWMRNYFDTRPFLKLLPRSPTPEAR